MASKSNVEILIRDVRFSYLYAFQPFKGETGDTYCSHFIFPPTHLQCAEIAAAIKSVAKAAWGDLSDQVLVELKGKDKLCLHKGDVSKPNADGYKSQLYISGNKKVRFPVIETRNGINVQLTQADGRPLSGDFGNAKLAFWAQDSKYGKRINADILGIQYTRKGTALGGGGRVADMSEFGIDPSDADSAAPATAGSATDVSDLMG